MDLKVRYVTQSAAFDRLLVGRPLTNRRIAFYRKQGRYGPVEKKPKLLQKPSRPRGADALLAHYGL